MIFIIIIAIIAVADILIKKYVNNNLKLHEERLILNGKMKLTRYHNEGAVMNTLKGKKKLIITISSILLVAANILFIILIHKKRENYRKLAFSFIIGGGASNLYDRCHNGYVTDYLNLSDNAPKKLKKIVFNIADLFIFIGAIMLGLKEV